MILLDGVFGNAPHSIVLFVGALIGMGVWHGVTSIFKRKNKS